MLLTRPVDAPALTEEQLNSIQDEHLANQSRLRDEGYIVAAGPFINQEDERYRGFTVLSVNPQRARELYNEDPAVKAHRLEFTAMTWMVPAGNVRFEAVAHPRSMAEAES